MIAIRPAVILLPEDRRIIFARVVERMRLARPGGELVRVSSHGGHNHNDAIARLGLALHMGGRIFDAGDVCDGSSAKLHDEEHVRELWCKSEIRIGENIERPGT